MGIIQASKYNNLPLRWAPEPSLRLLLLPKPRHILYLATLSLHPSFLYPRENKENDCLSFNKPGHLISWALPSTLRWSKPGLMVPFQRER